MRIIVRMLLVAVVASFTGASALAADRAAVVIVVGAEGSEEFAAPFQTWAKRWQDAAKAGGADCHTIGLDDVGQQTDRDKLEKILGELATPISEPMWLVLIGHGTYDGKNAKFALRGPDVTPLDLRNWLRPIERSLAIIDCTSSSAPFVSELSGTGRVVVAATRSGHEYNFSRFGEYLSAAIGSPDGDLDKDQQTSLFEAFLLAASRVREFYSSDDRLVTEHAILDDNGDRLGTPADWFAGLRPTKGARDSASLDGMLSRQFILVKGQFESQLSPEARQRRADLEQQLDQLRRRKAEMTEEEYFARLEPLLVQIARLYDELTATPERSNPAGVPAAAQPAR